MQLAKSSLLDTLVEPDISASFTINGWSISSGLSFEFVSDEIVLPAWLTESTFLLSLMRRSKRE
jgi:hypothetical protein